MNRDLNINVCVRGSHDWLFGDLRERFARTQLPGLRVLTSEEPDTSADAWIYIRTGEASSSPDLARTVICLHDVYDHDAMYSREGQRRAVHQAAGLVLCHPRQRVILGEAGVRLEGKRILERPLGALKDFTVRETRRGGFTVGWVGRNHWRKRPEFLVETMRRFQPDCPDVRVMLVGKELESLRAEVAQVNVECELHDRGSTPISDYPALYRQFDCLLITSCTEAGPLPLFEALATGVPAVATPVGWAPHFAAIAPVFVRLGDTPEHLANGLTAVWKSSDELFQARGRIASLAESPRLDTWFAETLNLAATLVEDRR